MAALTATFRLVDEISAKLDNIARGGEVALNRLNALGSSVNSSFGQATASVSRAEDVFENYSRQTLEAETTLDNFLDTGREAENVFTSEARAAEQAGEEISQLGENAEGAGQSAQGFGTTSVNAVQDLSNALAAAGIAKAIQEIYEGFASAVRASIEFESAITGVYKTVNGSSQELAQINDEIKTMALALPASTTEIAGVAEAAGQLGIATNDITSFTEVMINLGEATNLTSEEAASALAKFSNITGMAATNYENLGSTIVALGNNFATTEADIVAMSTRMASAGTLAGLAEPEILALATAMSSVGIEADAGGSAMSKLLTDIQVAVETGSSRLDEFAEVAGMTGAQFSDAFGDNALGALYSFIDGLNDVERNGESATVILEGMGLTEVRLSNAIKSLANNSDGLSSAIDVANSAWVENTALANEAGLRYSTLESKLGMAQNAANNFAVAVGDDLTPVVGGFVDAGTDALAWLTDFVEENPAVTAALSGLLVGITTIGGALAIYTIAQQVATAGTVAHTIAQAALNVVMNANPVFLIITGVVALTAAVVAFVSILASQETEYDTWTASTKAQYDELEQLSTEYETACETYGETSDEAMNLRYEVDELTESFEANKKTVEQFIAECDALVESHDKMIQSFDKSIAETDDYEQSTLALINKLQQLATQNAETETSQVQMNAIIDKLNESVPDLALSYDKLTTSADTTIEAVRKLAQAEAEQRKYEATEEAYIDALSRKEEFTNKVAEAEANLAEERTRAQDNFWLGTSNTDDTFVRWLSDCDEYENALEEVKTKQEENNKVIAEAEQMYVDMATATEEAKNVMVGYDEAVGTAINSVKTEIDDLVVAYDEAYIAARDSIDGTIGLFDTMATSTELSINDMLTSMQSQVDYLETYSENLQKAAQYGLDEGLIASLSDGSEESAGYIDAIVGEMERLGESTAEAQKFAETFNTQFQEVESAKDNFASTIADMETDFSTKMGEIEGRLTESIENMNMEADAASAAKDTIQAYISQIKSMTGEAHSAAKGVAQATANALSGTNFSVLGVPGYASGTLDAPDLFIAGENGPELIVGAEGSTVFPAEETSRILSNFGSEPASTPVPESAYEANSKMTVEHKHSFEINGGGEIEMGSNVDKETVISMLFENMKPVLMNILKQESFEEGDLAYEF